MSELAARHLRRSGATHVFVTNRTHERAIEMAKLFQGTPVEYGRFVAMLPEVDILIASSGAPHYILHKDEMQRVIARAAQQAHVPDRYRSAAEHRAVGQRSG